MYDAKTPFSRETVISKKIGAWVFKILLWTLTILTVLISPLVGVVTSIVVIPLTALLVYVLIPLDLYRTFLRGRRRRYADDDGSENMSLVSNTEILNGLQNEDGEMAVFKSKEDEGTAPRVSPSLVSVEISAGDERRSLKGSATEVPRSRTGSQLGRSESDLMLAVPIRESVVEDDLKDAVVAHAATPVSKVTGPTIIGAEEVVVINSEQASRTQSKTSLLDSPMKQVIIEGES